MREKCCTERRQEWYRLNASREGRQTGGESAVLAESLVKIFGWGKSVQLLTPSALVLLVPAIWGSRRGRVSPGECFVEAIHDRP